MRCDSRRWEDANAAATAATTKAAAAAACARRTHRGERCEACIEGSAVAVEDAICARLGQRRGQVEVAGLEEPVGIAAEVVVEVCAPVAPIRPVVQMTSGRRGRRNCGPAPRGDRRHWHSASRNSRGKGALFLNENKKEVL